MNQVQAKYRSKYYYDRKLYTKFFMEGEMIYVLKEPQKNKYDAQYEGPYEIASIDYDKHNVKLVRCDEIRITHVDKIKKTCVTKAPAPKANGQKADGQEVVRPMLSSGRQKGKLTTTGKGKLTIKAPDARDKQIKEIPPQSVLKS